MAVLVEGISVIVRGSSIESRYPGGWSAFAKGVPNDTFCADTKLARIGFMQPSDVKDFIAELEALGLRYADAGMAIDIVVVDQQRGPTTTCEWVEFGHVDVGPDQQVSVCRLTGDTENVLASPDAWAYEGSLSQTFGFVPSGEGSKSLTFLRHEDGTDVYMNDLTGREVYIGRTSEE